MNHDEMDSVLPRRSISAKPSFNIQRNANLQPEVKRSMTHKQYSTLLKTTEVKGRLAEDMSIGMHEPNKKEITNFLIVMSLAMIACMSG